MAVFGRFLQSTSRLMRDVTQSTLRNYSTKPTKPVKAPKLEDLPPDYNRRYNSYLPGFKLKELKHEWGMTPLHVMTVAGSSVATWYIGRLIYNRDCQWLTWSKKKHVLQDENITLFCPVDYAKRNPLPHYPVYKVDKYDRHTPSQHD